MSVPPLEWDDGNWPKCGKHGVSKEEVQRFFDMNPDVFPDPYSGEQRFRAIGAFAVDRYLFVVFTLRQKEGVTYIRPVSVRYMHRKEVQRYEKDRA